jgi:hypothetical protein
MGSSVIEAVAHQPEMNGKQGTPPLGALSFNRGNAGLLEAVNQQLRSYLGSPDHRARMAKFGLTDREIDPAVAEAGWGGIRRGEEAMEASFRLIVLQTEADLRALCRQHVKDCIVTALEPTQRWFLIQTKTDAERDLLAGNETLLKEFKEVFRVRGCSDALVESLAFTFESQETVDRQYAGSWYLALK